MRFRRGSTFALTTGLLLTTAAFGQQYHSNDLTPPVARQAKLTSASQGKQVGTTVSMGYNYHAFISRGDALAPTDLNPSGYSQSIATSSDDTSECGYGYSLLLGIQRALKWSGTAASFVELSAPSGYNAVMCVGIDAGTEVGFAENLVYSVTNTHAIYWDASGAVSDLHPAGLYPYSRGMGIKGGEQVGYVSQIPYPYQDAILAYHTTSHAYRWSGTAASGVDLHPASFDASEAHATNGTQQAGWAYTVLGTSHLHAMLWSGDPQSAVDLSPPGYTDTEINALNATQQVGDGWVGTVRHALVWTGTADSVLDLNQYLPAGYSNGVATGIDASGNIVGYAYNGVFAPGSSFDVAPGAIAVVFAPGQAPPAQVSSFTMNPASARPGDTVQATVTLGGPAPAGGVALTFLSTDLTLAATPAPFTIAEGQTSASFPLPLLGLTITAPQTAKLYVGDGTASRVGTIPVVPLVKLASVTANPVEGGFNTNINVLLNIPAQTGTVVSLTSGDPTLINVPAAATVLPGYMVLSVSVPTVPVTATTLVPVTVSMDGISFTTQVTLSPAPVVALSAVSSAQVVGGQSFGGSVSVTNFPRTAQGATISLVSSDPSVTVPATVFVPQNAYSVSFAGTTSVVSALKSVTITASYNGSTASGILAVNPIPTVTMIAAEYSTVTQIFKVQATTSYASSILTFGTDPTLGPLGSMQVETPGVWGGATVMATAPKQATVWNSNGGQASMAVVIKTGATGGGGSGGGGGGGGGGSTSTTYKLTISTAGKGTVATTCGGAACASPFPSGTAVTLRATPAAGSPWTGWSGACTGTATTCAITMTKDTSVTATFR